MGSLSQDLLRGNEFFGPSNNNNSSKTDTCHYCNQTCSPAEYVECCFCSSLFCGLCLRTKHGENIELERQEGNSWVCPKCRNGCGPGCISCCLCTGCRKEQGLSQVGIFFHDVKKAGFTNLHDYLIFNITQESADTISSRKIGRGWCLSSENTINYTQVHEKYYTGKEDEKSNPCNYFLNSFLTADDFIKAMEDKIAGISSSHLELQGDSCIGSSQENDLMHHQGTERKNTYYSRKTYHSPNNRNIKKNQCGQSFLCTDSFNKKKNRIVWSDNTSFQSYGQINSKTGKDDDVYNIWDTPDDDYLSFLKNFEKAWVKRTSENNMEAIPEYDIMCFLRDMQSKEGSQMAMLQSKEYSLQPQDQHCTLQKYDTSSSALESSRSKDDLMDVEVITSKSTPKGFSEKLDEALKKPYCQKEFKDAWNLIYKKKSQVKSRELRQRTVFFQTQYEGNSYLDFFPDLAEALQSAPSREEMLNLMRGFLLYLEHISWPDVFKPWVLQNLDDECFEVRDPDHKRFEECKVRRSLKRQKIEIFEVNADREDFQKKQFDPSRVKADPEYLGPNRSNCHKYSNAVKMEIG